MQLRKLTAAMLVMGLSAGLAHAEDASSGQSTLDKIKANGVIVVGHRESSVPFSYYDNQQKVVGYSQDYSNAIVEAVKKWTCASSARKTMATPSVPWKAAVPSRL